MSCNSNVNLFQETQTTHSPIGFALKNESSIPKSAIDRNTSISLNSRVLTENMVRKKTRIMLTRAKKVSGMMLNLHGDLRARTSPATPEMLQN